jgi:hypothetical protein
MDGRRVAALYYLPLCVYTFHGLFVVLQTGPSFVYDNEHLDDALADNMATVMLTWRSCGGTTSRAVLPFG